MKTITVQDKTWKQLTQWKLDFDLKSLDEIIEKVLGIATAMEIANKNETK